MLKGTAAAILALVLLAGSGCSSLLYEGTGDLEVEPIEVRLIRITPNGLVPSSTINLTQNEGGIAFVNECLDRPVTVVFPDHVLPVLRCAYTNGFESDGKNTATPTPLSAGGGLASLCFHEKGAFAFEVRGVGSTPLRGRVDVAPAKEVR
jgi:hypothetical protein